MGLKERIRDKSAKIAIIGIGYVGYPLACEFSKTGYDVIGFDIDNKKIEKLKNGWKLIEEYEPSEKFKPMSDESSLKDADIYMIVVPTPLKDDNNPDLSYIKNASETIAKYIKKDNLVILVSTTYPSTTEDVVGPLLEKSGLVAGKDFYLSFCPERIDPGNKRWKINTIPQIVSGMDENTLEMVKSLYSKINDNVIAVSSLKVAEAVKIFENIFRSVNIALVNETAKLFEKLGIDAWEVIRAASTKPFGFMPHYPGPGVGGHCIPLDPYYLSYIAKKEGLETKFIELAGNINRDMPFHVLKLLRELLRKADKNLKGSNIVVLGSAYKRNIPDVRESPTKKIVEELLKEEANVYVFDPLVKEGFGGNVVDNLEDALKGMDGIILAADHDFFRENNIERIISELSPKSCVVDTRNFLKPELLSNVNYRCLGK